MTPEEVQKLLDEKLAEQREQILAEVDKRIEDARHAEWARITLGHTVTMLKGNYGTPEKRAGLEIDEKNLREIVPEKDWPENITNPKLTWKSKDS